MDVSDKVVRLEGYISKLSPNNLIGWQKRYFVLVDDKLKYFKNEKEFREKVHPKGILDFSRIKLKIESPKTNHILIHILGCERVFHLKLADQAQFDIWYQALEAEITKFKQSDHFKTRKHTFDFSLDFWRFNLIDEKQFLEQAETGDLLLFRGNHLGGKIQR